MTVSWRAVARRCSVKGLFYQISQNSQKNTCAGISFSIMFQTNRPTDYTVPFLFCPGFVRAKRANIIELVALEN